MLITDRVERYLKRYQQCRDSDSYLLACIWRDELDGTDSVHSFLGRLSRGEVTSPESIRRSRQKLQEENPELRGKRHQVRHEKWEPEVRMEVKEWLPPSQTSLF